MALTADEEKRIQALENALAEHTTAIKNLAAKRQLSHSYALLDKKITELEEKLTSLQSQLNALKK